MDKQVYIVMFLKLELDINYHALLFGIFCQNYIYEQVLMILYLNYKVSCVNQLKNAPYLRHKEDSIFRYVILS
jgi:hypothetical protein